MTKVDIAAQDDIGGGLPDGFDSCSFAQAVTAAFGPGGALGRTQGDFRSRDEQLTMAQAVAQAVEAREALVVEAGTGVGKTFAYLVPVLLSGRRALISTATKSLQDQLFTRDLPRVRQALERPLTTALLKGRDSYLCLHRLKQARQADGASAPLALRMLARIERWAQSTTGGDMGEVEGLEERSPILPLVTSTRDNCLGSACPDFQACHVVRARREAMAADVVVVNHHLFFADMTLRDTGMAELLPSVDIVVFDEAHQLVDTGVQFLGTTLSSAQAIDVARDILAAGLRLARGLMDWPSIAHAVERGARDLRLTCDQRDASRRRWPVDTDESAFLVALGTLGTACTDAANALNVCSELDPMFVQLGTRARELAQRAVHLAAPVPDGRVRWIDVSTHHVRLIETPLDIAAPLTQLRERVAKTWIFTSATLGDDAALRWFTEPTGLTGARTLKLGSPYDHTNHARLWICADAPRPDDPAHADYVAGVATLCARRLGGRTIVLTTTLRALSRIADAMRNALHAGDGHLRILAQGEQPKRVLLQQLRERQGTVLVASQSFWEGIDVPGDALQCVIIDKLPFPPPNDPLIEARARRIEAEGGSAFNRCFVAEAAIALKQGAGRLIRSETDRGLLVVCDPRMGRMAYGKRLRQALPPMTQIDSQAQAQAWLDELAGGSAGAW